MNYEELSDFEINKRVAELRPYTWIVGDGSCPAVSEDAVSIEYKTFKYGNLVSHGADYCNQPEDAWPIISEEGISLIRVDNDQWLCESSHRVYLDGGRWFKFEEPCRVVDKRPLRAAMICFLMMQEAK